MDREIKRGVDHTFNFPSEYQNGIQQVPTSGTATIYNNGGSQIQTGAITISATGDMSYVFLVANNTTIGFSFKISLSYAVGGVVKYFDYLFDVAETPIINTVNDYDLYEWLDDLREKQFTVSGVTDTNGSTNQIQDESLKLTSSQDLTGGRLDLFVSNTRVHEADITAHDKDTGEITFSPAYTSTITANIGYTARPSYQSKINYSFERHVLKDIRRKMGLASKLIDSNTVRNMTVFKTLQLYCMSGIEEEGDKWDIRTSRFKEMYNDEYMGFSEPVDEDRDGNMTDRETKEKTSFVTLGVVR